MIFTALKALSFFICNTRDMQDMMWGEPDLAVTEVELELHQT